MKSLSPLLLVSILLSLLAQVTGFDILIQPQTVVGGTSVVFYAREPSDPPSFSFDLRFSCASGSSNEGLAYSTIVVNPGQTSGAVPVVFPAPGKFIIQAVVPGQDQVIATSNVVQAVAPLLPLTPVAINPGPVALSTSVPAGNSTPLPPPPLTTSATIPPPGPTTASLAPSSTPGPSLSPSTGSFPPSAGTSSSSSHSTLQPTPRHVPTSVQQHAHERKVNLPAVVGGVIGGLAFLGLLAALVLFMIKRKKDSAKRYTFHQDMMVQSRTDEVDPSVPRVTVIRGESPPLFDRDLEAGPPPPPATAPVTRSGFIPPKKLILASNIAPLRADRERPRSPITPRTKRNFPALASNPFNTEAENASAASPRTGIPSSLTPGPAVPIPFKSGAHDPFQDDNKAESDASHVPPSPRLASSGVVVPSPRGPRPSINKRGANWSGSGCDESSSSHATA